MIIFGYSKQYRYGGDGSFQLQVRIPSIHGAYDQSEYNGRSIHNYVNDKDLPWYPSVLLPHLPNDGEVVALMSYSEKSTDLIVIGLTGGFYTSVNTNIGGK